MSANLFPGLSPEPEPVSDSSSLGRTRLVRPDRSQREMIVQHVDLLIPQDHRARAFWKIIESLDLSEFDAPIVAREGTRGRPAIDRRILLCLWLYGISRGVASAAELAELAANHDAYRWIRGGVPVSAHTLSDFRVDHGAALDNLFTQVLALMESVGLIELECVAQDGMRVRADASSGSFRREATLNDRLQKARQHVAALKNAHLDGGAVRKRQQAAAERAAQEVLARTERAIAELPKIRAMHAKSHKKKSKRPEARASFTDPDARVMKMPDGGFRPAFNFQFATDAKTRAIVGVSVVNVGSDYGECPPMLDEITRRLGRLPKRYLVDGGYLTKEALEATARRGVSLFAPLPESKGKRPARLRPHESDTPATTSWRARMLTDDGKLAYRLRSEIAEGTNADLRAQRGLHRVPTRGLPKARCVALFSATALSFMRLASALAGRN